MGAPLILGGMLWWLAIIFLLAFPVCLQRHRRLGLGVAVVALICLVLGWPGLIIAQRFLSLLVMPIGLLWLFLGAASYLAWWRRWPGTVPLLAAWLMLGLCGNHFLGHRLLARLTQPFPEPAPTLAEWPRVDTIAVLGGGSRGDGRRAWLGWAGDRVLLAARLYRHERARQLITTGQTIDGIHLPRDLSHETAQIWQDLGIPSSAILGLPEPRNTREEVQALVAWQQAHPERRLAVISSAYHLPRIQALCTTLGLQATLWPADRQSPVAWSLISPIPSAEGVQVWKWLCWEYLGRLVGR